MKSTVASTMSLRPKDFKRTEALDHKSGDLEVFLNSSLRTLQKGTYNELDRKCQEDKFERFMYKTNKANLDFKTQMAQSEQMFRDTRRQDMLTYDRTLTETHNSHDAQITTNWKATQKVKKDRQVRDLQYEMALLKVAELKDLKSRQVHRSDQVNGVTNFERIMKRSGLGAGSEGGTLSVTYEDGEAFLQRLEQTAKETFPSNEETSNFVTQLKERTQDNRTARYEKARRRRRALVDQNNATAAAATGNN